MVVNQLIGLDGLRVNLAFAINGNSTLLQVVPDKGYDLVRDGVRLDEYKRRVHDDNRMDV